MHQNEDNISIETSLKEPTKLAYKKLFEAAYNLAEGMLLFNKFKVLVKHLRDNKVKLISGCDDHRACEEYVSYLAESIRDKLAMILLSSKAFSILTDGSEARKTGMEKELIFIRVICGGIPVYFCSALQDWNEFGSTNADSLKLAVDTAFDENNGLVKLPKNTYKYCMISSTADGASVNFGKYSGLLTQQKENHPWLIMIHCVAHRAELALKDSLLKYKEFKVNDLMASVFYLHKRSGKLKRMFKETATALNIDGYVFPKVTGTRFVTHQLKGAQVLLHNWTALADSYCTAVADAKTKPTVQAKIQNHQKKLNDFQFRCDAVMYYKILSVYSTLQFEFEKKFILASDVCNL